MFLVLTALNDAYAGYNTPDARLKLTKYITMQTKITNAFTLYQYCKLNHLKPCEISTHLTD